MIISSPLLIPSSTEVSSTKLDKTRITENIIISVVSGVIAAIIISGLNKK